MRLVRISRPTRGSSQSMTNHNKPLPTEPISPIEVDWPPCIVRLSSGTFAVSGSKWLSVPPDTVFDDLPRYMVVKPRKARAEAPDEPVRKTEWKVRGSTGNEYVVIRTQSDSRQIFFSCTCPGYGWRGKCKHIDSIKKQIEAK